MSILNNIEAELAVFAAEAVAIATKEGVELGAKVVESAKEFGTEVAGEVRDAFQDLVSKLGDAAARFVTALWNDPTLSGLEKANLAATQLVQHATENGIAIASQDVSALIKTSYLAVKDAIAKL